MRAQFPGCPGSAARLVARRTHRRGRMRDVVGAMAIAVAAGVGWPGSAAADSAGVPLRYTCAVPGLPNQPMTAQVAWNAPASVTVGQTTPAMTVTAPATIGPTVTWALGFLGATTVEGSVDAPVRWSRPAGTSPSRRG